MTRPADLRGLTYLVGLGLGLGLAWRPADGEAAPQPQIVISLEDCTLRLETGRERRIFPVAVARLLPDGKQAMRGTFYTGPDPRDEHFYMPSRREPAFHRGLPFLRLDRRSGGEPRAPGRGEAVFGIHGPVTSTLIWGRVSAGCVRMRPGDLRVLYAFAVRHPGLPVRFVPEPDRVDGRRVSPAPERMAAEGCEEAALGLRRLRRAALGVYLHDRLCGGVDQWWVVELKGGETLRAQLQHSGRLRIELYGIRAISQVAAGRFGFAHTVPPAYRNRGDRYLRISSEGPPEPGRSDPYVLTLDVGP